MYQKTQKAKLKKSGESKRSKKMGKRKSRSEYYKREGRKRGHWKKKYKKLKNRLGINSEEASAGLLQEQRPVHSLNELPHSALNVLSSWIAPGSITNNNGGILCVECFTLIQARATSEVVPPPEFGHQQVCLSCGISILRARSYRVSAECPERNVLLRFTPVHQVSRLERVCAACWRSANREVHRQQHHDANRPRNKESRFECQHDGCGKVFLYQKALDFHFDRTHKVVEPTICDWPNCGKSFKTAQAAEGHKKRIHYKRAKHKCTKCEKGFDKFEDIKTHFLQTHTRWKESESSTEKEQPNTSNTTEPKIDKVVPTSSVPAVSDLRSLSFTPDVSDNDDLSSDGVDFESFFEKPKLITEKVEITYECDWKDCGKCFVTTGDLEKHKKTHLVDNDTISQKCTKCDARFDSFELVKIHFLEAHTKWKKEDVLDEAKASEDVAIVKEYAGNQCEIANKVEDTTIRAATKIATKVGAAARAKTKKFNSKNTLNRRETDKIFSAITTRSRVKNFAKENKDTILNEKQPVPNLKNIVDDPKNTFVIFSDNAIEDSNKSTFYIIKTKPNLENSTTIGPNSEYISTNTATNVTNNVTQASCSSSFTERDMTNAKLAMSYAQNLMPDLNSTFNVGNMMPVVGNATSIFANAKPVVGEITPNLANIIPVVGNFTQNLANIKPSVGNFTTNLASVIPVMEKVTPDLENVIPVERNITPDPATFIANFMRENTSHFTEDIPVKVNIIPKAAKVLPNLTKYISPDVANSIPEVKTITSNAIAMPEVSKITSMLANIIPVVRNLSHNVSKPIDNVANTAPNSAASTVDSKKTKVKRNYCQCSNCLDSFEHRIGGRKLHICDICGQTSTEKYHLDKHMKEHTGAGPYFCPFKCGKRFNSRIERTRHIQEHTKLNIFVCEMCHKGFIREDLLKKHVMIHNNYSAKTQANSDDDIMEIDDQIDSRNNLSTENTDNILVGNAKGGAVEITDEDDSEAEDNNKNSTSESSDEDSSSEEENITNDNVEAPSLVEDEVCLDLGENMDNTTPDPLSGITSFEDMSVPLPQIIKREEETTESMLKTLAEENKEIIPVQRNNTEENIDLIAHNIVNIREDSLECMHLERTNRVYEGIKLETEQVINAEECVEPITHIVNIQDRILERSMEFMPLERIERVYEGIEPMSEEVINTEECEEPMIQTVNIGEDSILQKSMEFMPLNRVHGAVETISKKLINTEECVTQIGNYGIELMPLETIKREDEGIEPISEQIINTEDCVVSTPIQILNTGEDSMEFTPSGRIKRETEEIDPISEQLINTVEESIDLIPAKRIKREEDHIKYFSGQRINVADAD